MTRDHKVGTILTFILGAGVGAVTALLLAPKAGKELRDDIADGVSDGVNRVRGTGKDGSATSGANQRNSWLWHKTTYRMRWRPAKTRTATRSRCECR